MSSRSRLPLLRERQTYRDVPDLVDSDFELQDQSNQSGSERGCQESGESGESAADEGDEPARDQPVRPKTLYERLGGIYNIAMVVDKFSDDLISNPIVGEQSDNKQLSDWSKRNNPRRLENRQNRNFVSRLPGLKFLRTLWLCEVAGGPQHYIGTRDGATALGLENAHCPLRISGAEFNEVAAVLQRTLEHYGIAPADRNSVLAAFAVHKLEVTKGSKGMVCPFRPTRL